MSKIARVRLGEICSFKYGTMPKKTEVTDEGYPMFSGYRIVGRSRIFHYREPQIVVVARGVGGTGDVKMSPPFAYLTNLSIAVLVESPKVDKGFLFQRLASTKLWGLRTGSAQAQITIEHLKQYEIELPPLSVQRRIAAIASAYDGLIDNSLRRIRILEEMGHILYREWFVNFQFPGFKREKLVESSEGLLPASWYMDDLVNVCDLTMGQSPKSEFYNAIGEGMPFHQGVADFGERFPQNRLYCTDNGRIAEPGDILFSVRAPVGRMNIARNRMVIGRGLSALRHKAGFQEFLWEQLRDKFYEEDMIGNGAIFAAATKKDMQSIRLVCPTEQILISATERLRPLHALIATLSDAVVLLRRTRDFVLPPVLSGKVELNDIEPAA